MTTLQATLINTTLPLVLTIDQEGVGGVAGEAPTVALRLGSSTNLYVDWTTGVFMAAGWVVRDAVLTDIGGGTYQQLLDMTILVGVVVGDSLVAEYEVSNPPIVGVDHDSIEVVAEVAQISLSATASGVSPLQTVAVLCSLVRNGVQVTAGLVGATCIMSDPSGAVIFGPVALAAEPNGYFSLSVGGLSLSNATNYNFIVTITDAFGSITNHVITPTVGP